MNIVVCTPSQEDIEFFAEKLSGQNVRFFKKHLDEEILAEISDCEIFSGRIYSRVDEGILEKLPKLKFIVTHSTGFDHIDVAACTKRDIKVLNVPSYGERSIAEFVIGLMLSLVKNIHRADRGVQRMQFDSSDLDGMEIFGKTIGIVGTGKIGKEVAKISRALGMKVIAYDVYEDAEFAQQNGVLYVLLEELLKKSDIVSLHVPYLKETHHFMNAETFSMMKPGSFFINTARGAVVDTAALVDALRSAKLKGAALDVFEYEKVLFSQEERRDAVGHGFEELKKYNILYTPHMAAHSTEAQHKKLEIIVENISSCIDGEPANVVSLT
jgi:D-lactate dehydrogenase